LRLLIVLSNFVPEIGSAQHIYFDLATALVKRGHEVDVITSYPREENLDKKDMGREFPLEETINGIHVHRVKHSTSGRDNVVMRGLEHYRIPLAYYGEYKRLHKKFDACLIFIPPLPLYYFARRIKQRDGVPTILNYQDFHPQELVDVGMLTIKPVIKVMEYMERQSYRNADYITTMSKAGIGFINDRVRRQDNIACIYNSVNLAEFNGLKKDFKAKEGIQDKFLVSYAGIFSPFQGLDDVLDAAKLMKDQKDIVFYLVGDGMVKKHLMDRVSTEGLDNVRILPLQPRDEYFNVINSSDINVVTLDKRMSAPALPGKFINLLGVRRPILANIPRGNDVGQIVKDYDCGIVTEPGNPEQICAAVMKLKADSKYREECGARGWMFLQEEMNLDKNVEVYEGIFRSLSVPRGRKSTYADIIPSKELDRSLKEHARTQSVHQRH